MSAAQFIEELYGELPELFKDEDELRTLWSQPNTRSGLLTGLEEKGFGHEQLRAVGKLINAEKSDLFDVLAYIAFALPTITRKERVENHKETIFKNYPDKRQEFLAFVLDHYVAEGVGELDQEKLPNLLELKYHSMGDAIAELGAVGAIRDAFVGFQAHLYADD